MIKMSNLGIFAFEKKMPGWLDSLLRKHGVVSCAGELPTDFPSLGVWQLPGNILMHHGIGGVDALKRCLAQTVATELAYLCDPCVLQIFKLRREGEETISAHLKAGLIKRAWAGDKTYLANFPQRAVLRVPKHPDAVIIRHLRPDSRLPALPGQDTIHFRAAGCH